MQEVNKMKFGCGDGCCGPDKDDDKDEGCC